MAAALVEVLEAVGGTPAASTRGRFRLERFGSLAGVPARERAVLADQSNASVVVGERAFVKWRTAFDADGERAVLLRRQLALNGFEDTPALLGSLAWVGPDGRSVRLADVDAYLPGATDGWDHFMALLAAHVRGAGPAVAEGVATIGSSLGELTARLHLALGRPSRILPEPRRLAPSVDVEAWSEQALAEVEAAARIEAEDSAVVVRRRAALERDLEGLRGHVAVPTQPIHGDLHIGQLVHWSGGLAVIDLDGPPGRGPEGVAARQPLERDVAQMLCSLDHLAAAVDARTDHACTDRLRAWAERARAGFLDGYRATAAADQAGVALDEPLLEAFTAQQLCRELLYAAERLPRWRYAPLQALRWRYPSGDET
jgi:maltokinase